MADSSDRFADEWLAEYVLTTRSRKIRLDVASLRDGMVQDTSAQSSGPEIERVRDWSIGSTAARLYEPKGTSGALVVYLHGGGWTIGSIETHDRVARRLAEGSGAALLAVDYRLAPEHPWPASVDDAVGALRWVRSSASDLEWTPSRVAVVGDSAGGALATLACIRLREEDVGALPDLQVLIYPNTDLSGSYTSMQEKGTGFLLEADTMRFFASQWVPDAARWEDPGVSALRVPDLSALPPTFIVTAEHDPLRDEAEMYAQRLCDAGVEVRFRREPGLVHGFIMLEDVSPACTDAVDRIVKEMRAYLNGS